MTDKRPTEALIAAGCILAMLSLLVFHPFAGTAHAAPSSSPAVTYGRMKIPASAVDGGGAVPVPTACMSPRALLRVYNMDGLPVCCGGDPQVTCTGATAGLPIPPADGGQPVFIDFPLNCNGVKGVLYCWSDGGTISNGFGWMEMR